MFQKVTKLIMSIQTYCIDKTLTKLPTQDGSHNSSVLTTKSDGDKLATQYANYNWQPSSFSDIGVLTSYKSKALCVLDSSKELSTQNLTVGVRWQVKEVEAGMSHRQILLTNVHRLNYHLHRITRNSGINIHLLSD